MAVLAWLGARSRRRCRRCTAYHCYPAVARQDLIVLGTRLQSQLSKRSIDNDAAGADLNPTRAQIAAGTARLGHVRVSGLAISVENPAGSRRVDQKHAFPQWATDMTAHYGYVKGTEGSDGDHVDVFVKVGTQHDWDGTVYVIDQQDSAGKFDEHKCMLGYASEDEACKAYLSHYSAEWKCGPITPMSLDAFKQWLEGDTTQPVANASIAKRLRKYNENEARDNKGEWTSGGDTTDAEKVARALAAYKPSTKEKQDLASAAERKVAEMIGTKPTGDNLPVDAVLKVGKSTYGVEVKSVSDNSNSKITMHPESLARKVAWGRSNHASLHTVVVDTKTNTVYYRKGVGSFRLHTLTQVDSAVHLRTLMGIE